MRVIVKKDHFKRKKRLSERIEGRMNEIGMYEYESENENVSNVRVVKMKNEKLNNKTNVYNEKKIDENINKKMST